MTVLMVAAEPREFSGILKRASSKKLDWPGAAFAREVAWNGERWLLVANGAGERQIAQALGTKREVDKIFSVGFCGALDPSLAVGDVVEGKGILTSRRVAVTVQEKRELREQTGALVVEMEARAVEEKARQWGVPFGCVKVVSDTAAEDLPLDFNRCVDGQGRFSRTRIVIAALLHPSSIPGLMKLERNCRQAAEKLGEFFAHRSI